MFGLDGSAYNCCGLGFDKRANGTKNLIGVSHVSCCFSLTLQSSSRGSASNHEATEARGVPGEALLLELVIAIGLIEVLNR
jgi:hypothetical protein